MTRIRIQTISLAVAFLCVLFVPAVAWVMGFLPDYEEIASAIAIWAGTAAAGFFLGRHIGFPALRMPLYAVLLAFGLARVFCYPSSGSFRLPWFVGPVLYTCIYAPAPAVGVCIGAAVRMVSRLARQDKKGEQKVEPIDGEGRS